MDESDSLAAGKMAVSELPGRIETMKPPTSPRRDIGATTRRLEMPKDRLSYDIGGNDFYADADKSVDDTGRHADVQEAHHGCNTEIPHEAIMIWQDIPSPITVPMKIGGTSVPTSSATLKVDAFADMRRRI